MSLAALHMESDSLDPRRFRTVIGAFATGVAVITTAFEGAFHGMTINSLTSVSLDPCLLLVCPRRGSATGAAIRGSGAFAVNIRAADQRDLSHRFVRADIAERFAELDIELGPRGVPLLPGAIAHLCCRVSAIHPGGDHEIVVGEVRTCSDAGGHPLLFHKGSFGAFRGDA
ncbi:flavin reductase family protein [Aquabacter spiritensis]|uniref:3-hydroxy-9,10-secoandrosta-1,3,5(10)-triene-9, 17-dione monooxygenase reductase component n=1 Tax=Aquabacter spiritensis TaxID=933073 RepID=A0A4R3M4Q5_9HYPH|nr:flavin reductase family protein [Aquabacter spiritensis]TCT08324.1 3-hydroxy-9,10-secoandrosta-1,3,5(10)-triene-9,17-dione monooxygenase reductase component [Aquabacter spiritensis]